MKLYEAKKIIENVFENSFDKDQFCYFIKNILKLNEFEGQHNFRQIPHAFENVIEKYERITKFEDEHGNTIDVLIVELKKAHSVEYARSTQRNFIRRYLNGTMGGELKDAALVAFYSQNFPEEWRFSLIKMQYSLEKKKDEYTPAKRFSFLVGEKGKSHTAKRQLVGILKKENIPDLGDLEEAFNIETVTNEFFEQYKKLLFNLVEAIEQIIKKDTAVKKEFESQDILVIDFCKKLLGQIVFLYFLQKKGWLGLSNGQKYGDGDKHFLRSLYEMKRDNESFFNDYLEWLFYDALSKKRVTDFYSRFNCRIPFLNGGLFDPINFYDWENTDIIIPDSLFTNNKPTKEDDIGSGILDVFDRYNFTVKEDEPLEKEVAVDPEMLGKVFERMLDVKERKSKGAFYTPREIVHYMSQESLVQYLDTALNEQPKSFLRLGDAQTKMFGNDTKKNQSELLIENSGRQLVAKEDIEKLIKHGEIIIEKDTAIQQGKLSEKWNDFELPESIRQNAKLIDEKLADIRVCDPAVGSGVFPVGVMHEIVKARSILAKILQPEKEPNVYAFKQHAIHHCLYGVDIDASAVEICKLRLWLSLVVHETRIDVIEPLPNLDYKIVRGNSLIGIPDGVVLDVVLKDEIDVLKNKYYSETDKDGKKELKQTIDDKINQLLKSVEPYVGYPVDFDFRLYFHEVYNEKKGFDVVIANPPYVSHDKIENKKLFKGYYKTYEPFADLYIYFIEKALKLQNEFGILCFITSNSYLRSEYGKPLRRFILTKNYILELINIEDFQIFDSAIVNTAILISQNNSISKIPKCMIVNEIFKNQYDFELFVRKNSYFYSQNDFLFKSWSLISPEQLKLKKTIESSGKKLEILGTKIRLGIATGANNAFIINKKIKNSLIKKDKKNQEIIKPILRGRDIQRYFYKDSKLYIILTKNDINVKLEYPSIYEYFNSFGSKFKSRGAKGKHWANLRACSFFDDFKKEKIIWIELTDNGRFALSTKEIYLLNSAYFLIPPKELSSKFLLSILNSKVIQYYLGTIAETSGMGTTRWINNFVKEFPIPILTSDQQIPYILITDFIIFLKQSDVHLSEFKIKYSYFEQLIDGMVFELYFEDEIKKAGRDILKHLTHLTPITDDMSDEQKMKIITNTFNELYEQNHPVRQNLYFMDTIEEIRIIKGLDNDAK